MNSADGPQANRSAYISSRSLWLFHFERSEEAGYVGFVQGSKSIGGVEDRAESVCLDFFTVGMAEKIPKGPELLQAVEGFRFNLQDQPPGRPETQRGLIKDTPELRPGVKNIDIVSQRLIVS